MINHNLASVLDKRSVLIISSSSSPPHQPAADSQRHKRMSGDQSLATAVMPKIEDCNTTAAICIITSQDSPAADDAQTYQSHCDRHPQAPADRISPPDPSKFFAAQFTEEDGVAAIRSFPAGSAWGPDSVRL